MSSRRRITGFAPLTGDAPRWLILGSMPSVESLRRGEYYAHPRNTMWRILGALFEFDASAPYAARAAAVVDRGVAIWDVLAECERVGSLDTAIRRESETPNDLAEFVATRPSLVTIATNGTRADACLARHFPELARRATRLPSTSPAHAARSFDEKLAMWRRAAIAAGVVTDVVDSGRAPPHVGIE